MRRLCAILFSLSCAASVSGASVPAVVAELEPNNSKLTATIVASMQAGDSITGVTTGASTSPVDVTTLSADYYRIRTSALPAGVYRHRLVLTTSGAAGHQVTILGLDAVDVPPPTVTGTEVALEWSSSATTPPNFVQWYGFGRGEELYVRVTGVPVTLAPYQLTLSTTTVAPVVLSNVLLAGQVTITTEGQGHSTDTEIKVYDAALQPMPGFANDDTPLALPGGGGQFQSTLQRVFATGTYYVLLSRFNMANEQLTGPDDEYQNGDVLDFPDAVLSSDTTLTGSNVSFAVTDAAGTTAVAAALPPSPYEILWYQITVGQAWSVTPYCFGDAGGFGCPCANNGLFGRGCANSVNTFGALLGYAGLPSVSADTFVLQASGMPNGFVMYFEGTLQAQLHYGDGILCLGGSIVRLGLKSNVGGASQFPSGPDPLISVQGLVTPGVPFRFQGWYRDAAAYCTPATFNLTNALTAHWAP